MSHKLKNLWKQLHKRHRLPTRRKYPVSHSVAITLCWISIPPWYRHNSSSSIFRHPRRGVT